jgi:hypothetical protein
MIGQVLLGGALNGLGLAVVAYLVSRFAGEINGRAFLAAYLIAVGGAYFGFAVAGNAGSLWVHIELVQALVLGALALLGLRGSPYWLAAGWAVHPLWDVLLHYFGAGHEFTPEAWAISCISLDLVVAAYIAVAHRLRPVGGERAVGAGGNTGQSADLRRPAHARS